MLAQASNGLNYCVEEKMSELKNVFSASNSSYSEFIPNNNITMADSNVNETANSQPSVTQTQEQKQEEKPAVSTKTVEQSIQEQKSVLENKTSINTPAPSVAPATTEAAPENKQVEPAKEETPCAKAQADYEAKLAELETDIKAFKEFKSNFEKTSAENQVKSKRSRIENVIPTNYANSEEERTKAVESLMNVGDDQLDTILNSFVIPATRNVKQGGLKQRPKVTDFVKPSDKNMQQASISHLGAKDIDNLEKILNFGIVPKNKNNTGGI
jgi:hypothetical protein